MVKTEFVTRTYELVVSGLAGLFSHGCRNHFADPAGRKAGFWQRQAALVPPANAGRHLTLRSDLCWECGGGHRRINKYLAASFPLVDFVSTSTRSKRWLVASGFGAVRFPGRSYWMAVLDSLVTLWWRLVRGVVSPAFWHLYARWPLPRGSGLAAWLRGACGRCLSAAARLCI